MTEVAEGRWAELPNGRVVRIVAVDGEMVLAEGAGGRVIDRPVAHVRSRWRLLSDDALLVRALIDPVGIVEQLQADPVQLVASAIRDLGGDAETPEIQALLRRVVGPSVGEGDAFKDWWRRVQPRLRADHRIDDSRSLERRYRLLAPGEAKPQPYRDRVSDDERGGRRLAFAPLLKRARERARSARPPLTDDERVEFALEAAIAGLPELDPTDRFMAAELGTWLGLQTTDGAVTVVGDDLLRLDLLRIPQKASRITSIAWAARWLATAPDEWTWSEVNAPPTGASAAAAGLDSNADFASFAARAGVSRAQIAEGAVAWAYPGSEASHPWKLPADYGPYEARLERIQTRLPSAEPAVLAGIERGAITALAGLASSDKHLSRTEAIEARLAAMITGARVRLAAPSRAPAAVVSALPPKRLEALLQVRIGSGGGWARGAYLEAVEVAFARDPDGYAGAVRLLGTLNGEDPGAIALRVARGALRRARVPAMALAGSAMTSDPDIRAYCDSLAGTADPDDPRVRETLGEVAEASARALLQGEVTAPAMQVFTDRTWAQLADSMRGRLAEAAAAEQAAGTAVLEANRRADELSAAAEQARASLAASRSAAQSEGRVSSAKLAANVLKPIAAALADSLETPSLEALQDRLAAVLERAHIEPIFASDEVLVFDPDLHRWVGEGVPTEHVSGLSPGFIARLEGEHAVVLVPARVVAAPEY